MKKILPILLLLLTVVTVNAQENCLLEQAPVQDLVQDYANILSDAEEQTLRQQLLAFNDTVSNQILIVTVINLCNYDKAEFTYTLGENWGVGQDGKDNGIVIMVKPKEIDGRGEVFIAPGYGLEGVLPDAIAKRIVEREMIPYFKQQDYYEGIASATSTIMSITSGEFTAEEYSKTKLTDLLPFLGVIFIIIIIMIMKAKQTRQYASTNNLGFWAAWGLMNATSRSHGGSYGGFSSGGGSFGGFGGGSFGGGGAGGSW
jgi:uncharacterized protein